jgi:hypothetical protein
MMTDTMIWKCEQWFAGQMQEQQMFMSEGQAREFARKLSGVAPDLVLKIEPMPIKHVWN